MSVKSYFKNVFAENNQTNYPVSSSAASQASSRVSNGSSSASNASTRRKSDDSFNDYTSPIADEFAMSRNNEEFNPAFGKYKGNSNASESAKRFYPRF